MEFHGEVRSGAAIGPTIFTVVSSGNRDQSCLKIKERLIGAAIRCYWYVSGHLLGKCSGRTGNSVTDSGRRIGNLNKVGLASAGYT